MRRKRANPRRREAPRVATHSGWDELTMLLWARARGLCELCGENKPTERHHRKRRRDGGDRLANLLFLCSTCHRWITDNAESVTLARAKGYIVPALGIAEPESWPVLQWGTTWVLLDDDGRAVACDPPRHA
jgi:5-methylcytosine-specific restriction endonuclease McrA